MPGFWITARSVALVASLTLYAGSLFLPAIEFVKVKPVFGAEVLAVGWLGVITLRFAWFANPAFVLAAIAFAHKKTGRAVGWSITALVLGASSTLAKEWWFNEGVPVPIRGLGIAFEVWMLSFLILLAGCAIPISKPKPWE
ncbi:hypothetical protein NG726_11180 [Pseudomonas sp. MOB-449]|nr:hypothetical protein [Pseudomonas sp. MOB-449]